MDYDGITVIVFIALGLVTGIAIADLANIDLVNKQAIAVEELNNFDRGAYCFDWFEIGLDAGEKEASRENSLNNSIQYLNELKQRIILYDRIYSCEQELKPKYWINESYFEKINNPDGFLHHVQPTPEGYDCLLFDEIGIFDAEPFPPEHLDGCIVALEKQEKT